MDTFRFRRKGCWRKRERNPMRRLAWCLLLRTRPGSKEPKAAVNFLSGRGNRSVRQTRVMTTLFIPFSSLPFLFCPAPSSLSPLTLQNGAGRIASLCLFSADASERAACMRYTRSWKKKREWNAIYHMYAFCSNCLSLFYYLLLAHIPSSCLFFSFCISATFSLPFSLNGVWEEGKSYTWLLYASWAPLSANRFIGSNCANSCLTKFAAITSMFFIFLLVISSLWPAYHPS